MKNHPNKCALNDEKLALTILCTPLALDQSLGIAPLSMREWNELESATSLGDSVGTILAMDVPAIQEQMNIDAEYAARLALLLARSSAVIDEAERLADLGIWIMTRRDIVYPHKLSEKFSKKAPVVLFGAGDPAVAHKQSIAIVGSRDISESGRIFAERLGEQCASDGIAVVSGAARGTDRIAMGSCLSNGGFSIGVVSDSLERTVREPEVAAALSEGRLCLLSTTLPNSPFSVGVAMGRNKYIHGLADFSVIVDCASGKGGTWNGAIENLRSEISPMFVRSNADAHSGNGELIQRGGIEISLGDLNSRVSLTMMLQSKIDKSLPFDSQVSGSPDAFKNRKSELKGYLDVPRRIVEIAEFLGISEAKAREVLDSEVQQGRVVIVKKRPATYQDAKAGDSIPDLFGN